MRAKTPKVYTLAQLGKLFNVTGRSIRNYVKVGLIHAIPGPNRWMVVTEDELQRIKRDGLDTSGVTAKLDKLAKKRGNAAARSAAKKPAKRKAAGTTAKKQGVATRKAVKKQTKRTATAAARTPAKKKAQRGGARATRKK